MLKQGQGSQDNKQSKGNDKHIVTFCLQVWWVNQLFSLLVSSKWENAAPQFFCPSQFIVFGSKSTIACNKWLAKEEINVEKVTNYTWNIFLSRPLIFTTLGILIFIAVFQQRLWGKNSWTLMSIGIFMRAKTLEAAISVHPWSCLSLQNSKIK